MSKYPTLAAKGFQIPSASRKRMSSFASGYEGAQGGRRLSTWHASSGGANVLIGSSLTTLRTRVRDAIRNNPYAAHAMESLAANIVGTGIVPNWRLKDMPELKAQLQELWLDWTDEADADGLMDFYGMQELITKTLAQSGECLVRLRPRRLSDGLSVPLQLQVLEPDYLDEFKDGKMENGNTAKMGIEFDALGRRAAYWLYKEHPGEHNLSSFQSVRVPASQVLHIYRVDRPGQLRGVPWLTPSMVRLHLLDKYEDAELARKQTAALFAAFITTPAEEDPIGAAVGFGADVDRDDYDNPMATLEPGILQYLVPGEDVKFSEPADVGTNYEVFMKMQQRAIATGIGITYEQLTGDLAGVTFSSIRAGMMEFRRKAETIQHHILVYQFCRKVVQAWMAMAVASGAVKIPDFRTNRRKYLRVAWQPCGWDWINPLDDVQAHRMAVRSGFETLEEVRNARGRSGEEMDNEIRESNERLDEFEIILDSDPRRTAASGAEQNALLGLREGGGIEGVGGQRTDTGEPVDNSGQETGEEDTGDEAGQEQTA